MNEFSGTSAGETGKNHLTSVECTYSILCGCVHIKPQDFTRLTQKGSLVS